jgi:hypothetical protein
MGKAASDQFSVDGAAALSLMEQALALLDRCDAALEIGAHLDLAICRLREILGIAAPDADDNSGTGDDQVWPSAPDSIPGRS